MEKKNWIFVVVTLLLMKHVCNSFTNGPSRRRTLFRNIEIKTKNKVDDVSLVEGEIKEGKIDLPDEISSSFLRYSLSIILGRALPDARDGLKPVHRRIIFAMNGLGLSPSSSHRKCARVVGEVLGKYHPHGDMAVYDALVRLAQNFATGTPLIDGHGNFGSIDNDPAAAMRYTECRLTRVSEEGLLEDLYSDTVDFLPNFDGNEEEPLVLPARLPVLLLNGSQGIAVGMATNIPPHNLSELMDACIYLLEHMGKNEEKLDQEIENKLLKIIPGPDFPTGASIMGTEGAQNLYKTGNGSIIMRAITHFERVSSSTSTTGRSFRNAIIVTELPYQTNKSTLLMKIASLVNEKKIEGISDLRDESDRDGIRIVIELKKDALEAVVLKNLFKKTALQTNFSGNSLALFSENEDKNSSKNLKPQRFTLRVALDYFIEFRFQTIRRRTTFLEKKAVTRLHIVDGLLIALKHIDEIIKVIRESPDTATAIDTFTNKSSQSDLVLSSKQAKAVLKLQLGQLTRLNSDKLNEEKQELERKITTYNTLLTDDSSVRKLLKDDFTYMKNKFGIPRRTRIFEEEDEINDIDLVENSRSVIIVTRSGYIKRLPLKTFDSQRRGTRGKKGTTSTATADDGEISHCFTCNDHDTLLFLTLRGIAYGIRAFQIPGSTRIAKGFPIPSVLPIKANDGIASILPVSEFTPDEYCVLVTEHGWIKKTSLDVFENLSSRGLVIATLEKDDRLRFCQKCSNDFDILIGTFKGIAARFCASNLRATGRTSRGVLAMKLHDGDKVADMSVLKHENEQENSFVLVVTSNGYGKRIKTNEFRSSRRGCVGVIAIKFKDIDNQKDSVSCLRIAKEDDEVLAVTKQGIIVRQSVKDIPCQGRTATGVRVQKVDVLGGDTISSVSIVPRSDIDDES